MSGLKKTHLIYALLSVMACAAYGGFLIRNAIEDVDTVEETLPHIQEEMVEEPVTEPTEEVVAVTFIAENVKDTKPEEPPTTQETVFTQGFAPILPVEGTVVKNFSEKHIYNEKTKDWRNHSGVDISANVADNVISCEDGTITTCYYDTLWGNVIEIDHGEYISVYKNVSTLIMVKAGDSVKKGQVISGVGETSTTEGYSSPHIHFEMLHYGQYIDPLELID